MILAQYFEKQIQQTQPSDGNYLGEQTFDEAVNHILETHRFIMIDPETFSPASRYYSRSEAEQIVTDKIKEWKDHVNQHLLLYMAQSYDPHNDAVTHEIRKCWSGDIDKTLLADYEFIDMCSETLPRFRLRSV